MSIFAKPQEQEQGNYGPGKQYHLVTTEQLEQLIIDMSPEIRHDTNRMADMIRELVDTDREKAGLDSPKGSFTLWPNKNKTKPEHPDLLGDGQFAGRPYRVAAWFKGEHNLNVSVLPATSR